MTTQQKSRALRTTTRRERRLLTTNCLDEAGLRAFIFDVQIEPGRLTGDSHHERVLHLLRLVETEGLEDELLEWLERERQACVRHQLALLANSGPSPEAPPPEAVPATPASEKPQGEEPPAPLNPPTRASVRRLLYQMLPTAADLDAFCIDSLSPEISRRFTNSADREDKHNLLLSLVESGEIALLLRNRLPAAFARWSHLLDYGNVD